MFSYLLSRNIYLLCHLFFSLFLLGFLATASLESSPSPAFPFIPSLFLISFFSLPLLVFPSLSFSLFF